MPGQLAFAHQALGGQVDQVMDPRESIISYGCTVDSDAFVDAYQVG